MSAHRPKSLRFITAADGLAFEPVIEADLLAFAPRDSRGGLGFVATWPLTSRAGLVTHGVASVHASRRRTSRSGRPISNVSAHRAARQPSPESGQDVDDLRVRGSAQLAAHQRGGYALAGGVYRLVREPLPTSR